MFNLLIGSVITGSCDGCLDALNLLANPTSAAARRRDARRAGRWSCRSERAAAHRL